MTLFRTTVEEEVASACADAAGRYELGSASPDAYKMRIRASGYADQWTYRKRTWQEASGVYVSDS
ncbi:MAG TPA: hypothetical protein VFM55_15160 [Micromonosporaceae bacterium]|nr:hypothetical protein [Micromonosporaceae bacterium]